MADTPRFNWVRFFAMAATVALFVADYAFNVMAKPPPLWAYLVPGLLALGVEGNALARLLMQMLRAAARIPPDQSK